jgi:hypothetical protein
MATLYFQGVQTILRWLCCLVTIYFSAFRLTRSIVFNLVARRYQTYLTVPQVLHMLSPIHFLHHFLTFVLLKKLITKYGFHCTTYSGKFVEALQLFVDFFFSQYSNQFFLCNSVTTSDGYILTLFRIRPPNASPSSRPRPVALLWHGLLDSAYTWLYLGEQALPLKLVNAGYDVWLGNNRGSYFSNK